jgi:hypothetical protein
MGPQLRAEHACSPIQLAAEQAKGKSQAPVDRHRTDVQGVGGPAQALAFEHHFPDHRLMDGLQQFQHGHRFSLVA